MDPIQHYVNLETRRKFLGNMAMGLGTAALGSLLPKSVLGGPMVSPGTDALRNGMLGATHFAPKAKRGIYLFMSGAPSQLDMFDYKPQMKDLFDQDLPESIRNGQRLTTMTSGQDRFPIAPSIYDFQQDG